VSLEKGGGDWEWEIEMQCIGGVHEFAYAVSSVAFNVSKRGICEQNL
jgi:hypothetical protein